MKAFAYDAAHGVADFALTLRDLPDPVPGPNDLLVAVKAFALNPVDTKIRKTRSSSADAPVILGWDAAGVVEAVGADVSGFKPGDAVYYAGDVGRAGSYATLQAVNHRIVAHKPASLDFADAAALPLTALTAHEAMLERGITYTADSRVLIIGGAGGVGSLAIQLLKALTPATVIATASRPETIAWSKDMGADHVIGRNVAAELETLGVGGLHAIFITTNTGDYWDAVPGLLRPFGHLMVIDEPATMDMKPFKQKALTVHWEYMFAKAMFGFHPEEQGAMLAKLGGLVDAGKIRTTRTRTHPATVDALRAGHEALEAGTAIGKIVMSWD
ncbi:zinc-binding alcohol dehydrogenase family protein [Sphingobium nicotianae]|uniref:Zinc-type alcohol dehydrogenase-like protein n=1 Tax=Sphingobium nicotianae TaxID=2782607 RepID=A0A9X1DBF3_9SPHN|nr:zinc-binding alcohol dehydrogenase family protein [Sphingobium nicotianae]MBT2186815.1 zinc-binding alcohol dehydrogenase family protein [Sphingobium nicotianae]